LILIILTPNSFQDQPRYNNVATNNMATSFIPRPRTLLGQVIIRINMPFAAMVWATTMYWPSTYHEYLPNGLQSILPWPWATLIYFAISILILPIMAAEWEVRSTQRMRDTRTSAKSNATPEEL
jgi:hypothetical protein